jgi:hypothetical protein
MQPWPSIWARVPIGPLWSARVPQAPCIGHLGLRFFSTCERFCSGEFMSSPWFDTLTEKSSTSTRRDMRLRTGQRSISSILHLGPSAATISAAMVSALIAACDKFAHRSDCLEAMLSLKRWVKSARSECISIRVRHLLQSSAITIISDRAAR